MKRLSIAAICFCIVGTTISAEPGSKRDEKLRSEFVYPGATTWNGTVVGSSKSFVYNTVMATTDDLNTVVKFYKKKTGHDLSAQKRGATGQRVNTREGSWFFFHDDSVVALSSKARGVTIRYFAKNTKEYHVTLIISRVPNEKYTHIILTHVKK